jgi:hypothetical protein
MPLLASAVTLEWDRNPEPNVAGYRVYSGRQSRVYSTVVDVGNVTIAQLPTAPGTTFYAVTAYDDEGLESEFSEEVFYTAAVTNRLPVAVADSYSTGAGRALTVSTNNGVLVNDTDADGDRLTAVLVTNVANGTLSFATNGSFTYTPRTGFVGTDSFSYRARDARSTSAVARVTISVLANRAPVAVSDSYTVPFNQLLIVSATNGVLANDSDADGDGLRAFLMTSVDNGALTWSTNGSFTYAPRAGYFGTETFTYRATDGRSNSSVVQVTLTVSAPPPTRIVGLARSAQGQWQIAFEAMNGSANAFEVWSASTLHGPRSKESATIEPISGSSYRARLTSTNQAKFFFIKPI